MKICHITTVHPAQDARIFHRMCRALAARKIDVVLIASHSFRPETHLRPSPSNDRLGRATRPRRSIIALQAALAEDADVYHFHDPELIPMGLLLKTMRPAAAVVYDVHEDYPSMMHDKYWLPRWSRPAAAFGARLANRFAAACLDGIVVADGGVAGDFAKTAAKKTLVHYNFPSVGLFSSVNGSPAPSADLVYIGGLSERTGIFVLFDALKILAEKGVHPTVRLAGYTDGEKGLATITGTLRRCGLYGQVLFDGRLPHNEVPVWLQQGRIGLVLLQAVPKFMKNIPSKMFEYWACGLPVLASDLPPIRQFLVDGQHGYLIDPKNPAQLAERIAFLLSHPEHCQSLGQKGRRMIETHWNNERQIDALVGFYKTLSQKRSRRTRRAIARRALPNEPTGTD
jgi:glycosyltransferase involved in cell wall biosynthesis